MKDFDSLYFKAWNLMAYNYRQQQLLFVTDTVEWVFNSALEQYFTKEDNPMKKCLINILIPNVIA